MYKLHEKCGESTTLSPDRRSGKVTGVLGFVFSDRPLEDGTTFTCKLSGLIGRYDCLPVYMGVTPQDPASLPDLPDWDSVQRASSLVCGNGDLYKAGTCIGVSGVRLDVRDTTEVGVRFIVGEVGVYQDGVYKGVVYTGIRGPVWAVVYTMWYDTVSVICKETTVIAPEKMPVPVTYKMDSRPRGYAVIINMFGVRGKEDRLGSEHDVTRLTKLFKTLHFKIKTFSNSSAQDIYNELKGISKQPDLESHDCFILVLMSHGGEGYILGEDGIELYLEDIFLLFSNKDLPALRNKPKLFFVQSCNGEEEDNGVQPDAAAEKPKTADLPSICDMFVAKASVKGFKSYRNEENGSRFIQSLVDVFEEHAAVLDVGQMMTRVIRSSAEVHGKATNVSQCPVFKSTFTKDLYFNP